MAIAIANRSAICTEARKSSASIFRNVIAAHPTRRASSSCVKSISRRRCRTYPPNDDVWSISTPSAFNIKEYSVSRGQTQSVSRLVSLFISVVYFGASYTKSDKNAKKP
jgi:hypothetical protein